MLRFILEKYRSILYLIYRKKKHGILQRLVKCTIECNKDIPYYDDIVHPSIRKKSLANKKTWWMVYTPYYKANAALENPILCNSTDDKGEKWEVKDRVVQKPNIGYNSDPALFFDKENCVVFWREYGTERVFSDSCFKAVYAKYYTEKGDFTDINLPLLREENEWEDRLVSPAFIKYENAYWGYAMHLRFKNEKLYFSNAVLNRLISKLLSLSALLYLYNQQKCYGLAIWKTESLDKPFKYLATFKLNGKCKLYIPWHLDIFEYENKLYAVIQTNQCNADIVLAVSENYADFSILPTPLVTSFDLRQIGKTGLYKPTAFVEEDIFNLYVTLQDIDNRDSNRLYKMTMPFSELLRLASK